MVIVDDMNPVPIISTARTRMADDKRATEECFDAIVMDMHPQALTDQL